MANTHAIKTVNFKYLVHSFASFIFPLLMHITLVSKHQMLCYISCLIQRRLKRINLWHMNRWPEWKMGSTGRTTGRGSADAKKKPGERLRALGEHGGTAGGPPGASGGRFADEAGADSAGEVLGTSSAGDLCRGSTGGSTGGAPNGRVPGERRTAREL